MCGHNPSSETTSSSDSHLATSSWGSILYTAIMSRALACSQPVFRNLSFCKQCPLEHDSTRRYFQKSPDAVTWVSRLWQSSAPAREHWRRCRFSIITWPNRSLMLTWTNTQESQMCRIWQLMMHTQVNKWRVMKQSLRWKLYKKQYSIINASFINIKTKIKVLYMNIKLQTQHNKPVSASGVMSWYLLIYLFIVDEHGRVEGFCCPANYIRGLGRCQVDQHTLRQQHCG